MSSTGNLSHPKKTVLIGKIYADWCGHCKTLKPEWEKMKRMFESNMGRLLKNVKIQFFEFGDTEENKQKGKSVDSMVADFNNTYLANSNQKLAANGFPTLFRYCNGKLDYYNGQYRTAEDLWEWYKSACIPNKNRNQTSRKGVQKGVWKGVWKGGKKINKSRKNRTRKSWISWY